MENDSFLNEVINSNSAPENFREIYQEFRKFQKDTLLTLVEFHRVCEKNGINYQLAYGSLIGAIRHKGQIPWDYDVDVIVPFTEKNKLIDALNKDLSSDFYYYCPEKDPKCRHMIMRLAPKEYRTEALHVDVFYLTGSPEDDSQRKEFEQKVIAISNLRFGKFVDIKETSLGNIKKMLSLLIKEKLKTVLVPIEKIDREYNSLCMQYSPFTSSICVSADVHAKWCEYPTELLWETMLYQTDYGEVRIPVHYDELLTLMYGDYKKIPPLEQRIREVMNSYNRIKKYQSY